MAMVNNIYIKNSGLELELCSPSFESGYYRGTRFDHSGIFRRIIFKDFIIADEWFDKYNPYAHDAVCGASEEFTQSGYEETEVGGSFLKPGVGLLLKENNSDYDRFMLYKVVDSGKWNFKNDEDKATFIHILNSEKWSYVYEKTIEILDGQTFLINHSLCNTGQYNIKGSTYNHNFFTFDDAQPGPEIVIDFTFSPCGSWRDEYDSVALADKGIRFSRNILKGESVFMGNLKAKDEEEIVGKIYSITAKNYVLEVSSDQAFEFIVFWANHRVACIEPYIPYNIAPGEKFEFTYTYKISKA